MVKVLVLGKGFIGKKLISFFEQNNIDVFSVSQNEIDYTKNRTLATLLRDYNFSHVVNCCGYTGRPNVDGCEDNKSLCWHLNVVVASNIDKLCNTYNKKLIHISSGCVYSGYDKDYSETDEPNFGLYNPCSSFYSKSKHAFETIIDTYRSAVFRVRMPFTNIHEDRNYITKLLKYDNLINFKNSITCVDDLNSLILKFVYDFKPGIYNAVNPQPVSSEEVVNILKKYNLSNPNWKFVDMDTLNLKASRSNCILNTDKLKYLGLCLPDTHVSLERCIKSYVV